MHITRTPANEAPLAQEAAANQSRPVEHESSAAGSRSPLIRQATCLFAEVLRREAGRVVQTPGWCAGRPGKFIASCEGAGIWLQFSEAAGLLHPVWCQQAV